MAYALSLHIINPDVSKLNQAKSIPIRECYWKSKIKEQKQEEERMNKEKPGWRKCITSRATAKLSKN